MDLDQKYPPTLFDQLVRRRSGGHFDSAFRVDVYGRQAERIEHGLDLFDAGGGILLVESLFQRQALLFRQRVAEQFQGLHDSRHLRLERLGLDLPDDGQARAFVFISDRLGSRARRKAKMTKKTAAANHGDRANRIECLPRKVARPCDRSKLRKPGERK